MKIRVNLIQVLLRRDANTITPVSVPRYELTLLRKMFGKENVNGDEVVGQIEVTPEGEYERMCAKYGAPKVTGVYGDDGGERLAELVEREAVKDAAKPAAGNKKTAAKDDAEQPAA